MNSSPRIRRMALAALLVIVAVSVGLVVRHFLTPVRIDARWTLQLRSAIGPTDVYLGDSLVGTTPLDLTLDAADPRVLAVESSGGGPVVSARWVVEQLGEKLELLGPPSALPAGAAHGGLAGGVPMQGHPEDPAIVLYWFKEVARRTDGSLELVHPILIQNDLDEVAFVFLLRFRRGYEFAPDLDATQVKSGDSVAHRTLLREAEYRFSAILELGESHDLEKLAETHGGGEWWMGRFESGAPQLGSVDPSD